MYPMVSIAYSTTTGMSGLMDRVTVGPRDVAYEEMQVIDQSRYIGSVGEWVGTVTRR